MPAILLYSGDLRMKSSCLGLDASFRGSKTAREAPLLKGIALFSLGNSGSTCLLADERERIVTMSLIELEEGLSTFSTLAEVFHSGFSHDGKP
jgi:hypothetical protein